uniref:Plug domain-containing protein n=1 Tax=Steinernema glaseri TaxID=37863 RepID=A0A1I7XXE2_9BILA
MMVGYGAGNQPAANYHGSSVNDARRMQVLVDGRSVYRAGLATVDWGDIPLALEDIERIEVFRGPNTVSYGANALMAVVNILTRSPADSHGTRLKGQHYRDGRRLTRLSLSASHALNAEQSLDWQFSAKEGSEQRPYAYTPVFPGVSGAGANADVNAKDYAASVRWNIDLDPRHSLYLQGSALHWDRQQVWRACDAAIAFSPQLAQLWRLNPGYTERLARNIDA